MRPGRTFLFLLAVLLAGCGSPAAGKEAETLPPEGMAAAEVTAAGREAGTTVVTITPPAGWQPVEGSVLDVQYLKGTASFMVKAEDFGGADLEDVVRQAEDIFRKNFADLQMESEPEAVTIDGKDARQLIFTCRVSSIDMKYMYVYLYAADALYVITFADAASTFDDLAGDYRQILETIRFVSA